MLQLNRKNAYGNIERKNPHRNIDTKQNEQCRLNLMGSELFACVIHRKRVLNVRRVALNIITCSPPQTKHCRAIPSHRRLLEIHTHPTGNCERVVELSLRMILLRWKRKMKRKKGTLCGWCAVHVLVTFVWNSSLSAAENIVSFASILCNGNRQRTRLFNSSCVFCVMLQ